MDVAEARPLFDGRRHVSKKVAASTALIVLFVIGLHLRLDIYSGGSIIVPAYICLAAAAGLALINAGTVINRALPFVFAIWILAFVMAALKAPDVGGVSGVLNPTLQFAASVFTAAVFVISLNSLAPRHIRSVATTLWVILIVLAILETIALRELFSQISTWLYSGSPRAIYASDLRDLNIYGTIRAKSLASEPSFLSYTLSVLSLIRFVCDDVSTKTRRIVMLLAMFAIGYLISPSLSAIFFLVAATAWWMWPKSPRQVLVLVACGAVVAGLLALLGSGLIANPPAAVRSHMETGSFLGRILIGPPAGLKVLAQHPFTGLGIGNDVDAYPYIAQEWASRGGFTRFPWFAGFDATDLMSNGFWWQWIYLGVGGGVVVLVLVARMLAGLGVARPFRAIFCAWIVWYAGAAFVAPYSWILVAVFALSPGVLRQNVFARNDPSRADRPTPQRALRSRPTPLNG